jgi:hypothetical protein
MKISIAIALIIALAAPWSELYAAQQANIGLPEEPAAAPTPTPIPQAAAAKESKTIVLQRGTWVCLRPVHSLSSRTARRGDQVTFRVHGDVEADGMIVARDGTEVSAHVTKARKSGRLFHFPKLSIEMDQLRLVNGQTVPLEKYRPQACTSGGSENPAGDIALLVMLAPLLIPLAPFAKMDDEILDKDKCIDKQIARDIALDKAEISRLQPEPNPQTPPLPDTAPYSLLDPLWLDPGHIFDVRTPR